VIDDRSDDDIPPAVAAADVRITLGDEWKVEATSDDTLLFIERATRRSIEVGFRDLSQWFALLGEMHLIGDGMSFAEPAVRRTSTMDGLGVVIDAVTEALR
jgi:hypothetical protein